MNGPYPTSLQVGLTYSNSPINGVASLYFGNAEITRLPLVGKTKIFMNEHKTIKAGRPQKGEYKRDHKVTVAYNQEEFEMVEMNARRSGVPIAIFCRRASINRELTEVITREELRLIKSINNIGNNLNQLMRMLHSMAVFKYDVELNRIISDWTEIHDYLREVLRNGRKDQ